MSNTGFTNINLKHLNLKNINLKSLGITKHLLYAISIYELIIMFTLIFIIYTMPVSIHRFSKSLFGKLVIIISILSISYYNIIYGIVLAGLFIIVSEVGHLEGFCESEVEGFESNIMKNMRGEWNQKKRKARMLKDGFTNKINTKIERFVRKHEL